MEGACVGLCCPVCMPLATSGYVNLTLKCRLDNASVVSFCSQLLLCFMPLTSDLCACHLPAWASVSLA